MELRVRGHKRRLEKGVYEDDEKEPASEDPNYKYPHQIVKEKDVADAHNSDKIVEEDIDDIINDVCPPRPCKNEQKKISRPEKIPKVCIEDDLVNGMLGREEKPHEPDTTSIFEEYDEDSMDSMDALQNDDCECLFTDEEDRSEIEEDIGKFKGEHGNRNLSKLKPWEKTLPEFVVGHMSHSPCGPKVPYGTNRRCWNNGKCKGMPFTNIWCGYQCVKLCLCVLSKNAKRDDGQYRW